MGTNPPPIALWEPENRFSEEKYKPLACNDAHVKDAITQNFVVWCALGKPNLGKKRRLCVDQ